MLEVGDIVELPWEPGKYFEITGVPGDELYDSRGFVSAVLGCTYKNLGEHQEPTDWLWTFQDSFVKVEQNPSWEV